MKVTHTQTGIEFKKMFSKREVPYGNIRSVNLNDGTFTITTKDGEEIKYSEGLFRNTDPLYEAIQRYGIAFRNEVELANADRIYSIEQVNEQIIQMEKFVQEYATEWIREKHGADAEVKIKAGAEGEWIWVYFYLTKSGVIVKDLPEALGHGKCDEENYAFADLALAFMIEWSGTARYGVTDEVKEREAFELCLEDIFNEFLEK